MYGTLTEEQRDEVVRQFRAYASFLGTSPKHAAACTARAVLCRAKTHRGETRAWQGRRGSDAFAATLAVLAMAGEVRIDWGTEAERLHRAALDRAAANPEP